MCNQLLMEQKQGKNFGGNKVWQNSVLETSKKVWQIHTDFHETRRGIATR